MQHLPALLFFMSQELRVSDCELHKALALIDIPQQRCGLRNSDGLVAVVSRAFVQLDIFQAFLDGPFDVARQRPSLLTCCQFREVTELGVEPNGHRFRSRQLSASPFALVVCHSDPRLSKVEV
ncbi:hypothetical protein D3C87_1722200 [compost metagenome]